MDLDRDLRTSGGFSRENAVPVALPESGPTGDPWLRSTLVDGQTGAGSAVPNERADAQAGGFPLGERRYLQWIERFVEMPTTSMDRWQVVGPEIHGPNVSAFPQAVLMLEVTPGKHRRINANAGRGAARYKDLGPIDLMHPNVMEMDVILSADGRGRVLVRRDGGPWIGWDGEASIAQAIAGSYWKEANYRNAQINGRMVYDVTGMRRYKVGAGETIPAWDVTGSPPPPPPPPPPAGDTTAPRVLLTPENDGTWTLELPDEVDTKSALVGIAGDPFPALTITGDAINSVVHGQFDMSKLTPGETYWAWATAKDAAGNESVTPGRPFTPVPVVVPPAEVDTLLKGDLTAIRNRLVAAETWSKLTASQRKSILDARKRAILGLSRFPV